MKKTALVIMAAGIGSRYGGGIKQLEPVGLHDEIIMDYSIHDAVEAGFNKIVFVIRKDIEADFRERIGDRVEAVCRSMGVETAYAFQDMRDIPEGHEIPEGRVKPWGTGQAVLAALTTRQISVISIFRYKNQRSKQPKAKGRIIFRNVRRMLLKSIRYREL